MSYCINPHCPKPIDLANANNPICRNCGSQLLLQNRYRVLKQLGQGGFGNTFEIDDGGKTKVLKVLTENNSKAVELFQQEAKVLSQLNSVGIPKVEADGYFTVLPKNSSVPLHCLVMEKIEGVNLEQWMEFRKYQPIIQSKNSSLPTVSVSSGKPVQPAAKPSHKNRQMWKWLIGLGVGYFAIAALNQLNNKNIVVTEEKIPVVSPSISNSSPVIPIIESTPKAKPQIQPSPVNVISSESTTSKLKSKIGLSQFSEDIKPSEDGYYYILADNVQKDTLTAVKKVSPDAYLSPNRKYIYVGALKTKEEVKIRLQELADQGIQASVQQPLRTEKTKIKNLLLN